MEMIRLTGWLKKYQAVLAASIIWMMIAISAGGRYIRENYDIGLQSPYGYTISYGGQNITLICAYVIAALIIFSTCRFVYLALTVSESRERKILLYGMPIAIFLGAFLFAEFAHQENYYVGDEKNIWDAAVRLYPFIFVYSGGLFTVCFLLLPFYLAPSIVKCIFAGYVFGYIIYRTREAYNTKWAFLFYPLFVIITPFKDYGIRVHRMHWYAFLYVFVFVKLYVDHLEKKKRSFDFIILSFLISILTIWRREGLYLLALAPAILLLIYGERRGDGRLFKSILSKKNMMLILVFFFTEILVCGPELLYERNKPDALADGNVVYRAYLVHMMDMEGFDRELCRDELDAISAYIDIDQIDRINEECQADVYMDSVWEWPSYRDGEYYIFRRGWSLEEMNGFNRLVIGIAKKQPLVFLQSRLTAFARAGYSMDWYNLFLPLMMVFVIIGYMADRKDPVGTLLGLGVLGHVGITSLTMPASYFKYFFEMFVFAYVFVIIILTEQLSKEDQKALSEDGAMGKGWG